MSNILWLCRIFKYYHQSGWKSIPPFVLVLTHVNLNVGPSAPEFDALTEPTRKYMYIIHSCYKCSLLLRLWTFYSIYYEETVLFKCFIKCVIVKSKFKELIYPLQGSYTSYFLSIIHIGRFCCFSEEQNFFTFYGVYNSLTVVAESGQFESRLKPYRLKTPPLSVYATLKHVYTLSRHYGVEHQLI